MRIKKNSTILSIALQFIILPVRIYLTKIRERKSKTNIVIRLGEGKNFLIEVMR